MTDHLTSRAQRLIDEFEEGQSIRHGIARVLTHLADNYGDMESWYAVPASTLVQFAAELTAPTLLDRALGGDKDAAQWGADQELEACIKLLSDLGGNGEMIRRYRRPQ
jgi:hypothetical protein